MEKTKFCAYYRVSTQKQGQSGLGIEAQEKICNDYVNNHNGEIVTYFKDYESGKSRTRVGLWDAISFCKNNGATLIIAKLDRLARDVEFTFKVVNTGIKIVFCDMPVVNSMILGVFSSVAQYERELISQRTKAALDAKKRRGEEWVRNTDTQKAREKSKENRRKVAQNNASNIFLRNYLKNYENRGIIINKDTPKEIWDNICNELN
ncbi:MAG: recombinase family protein, partial [Anaeroplasma sp.]